MSADGKTVLFDESGNNVTSISTGDYNGDGHADLAVSRIPSLATNHVDGVAILLGNGDGSFGLSEDYPTGNGPIDSIASGDVTGDGIDDVVTSSAFGMSILPSVGDGGFASSIDYATIYTTFHSCPKSIAIADLNGDGNNDIVKGGSLGYLLIYKGSANSQPAEAETHYTRGTYQGVNSAGSTSCSISVADVSNDGLLDIIGASTSNNGNVYQVIGNGDGTFVGDGDQIPGSISYMTVDSNQVTVITGKFDDNDLIDIAATSAEENKIYISINSGTVSTIDVGDTPRDIVAKDFDKNGTIDIAVVNNGSDSVSLLSGNGDGTFNTPKSVSVGSKPMSLISGDFDNNGTPDIAVLNATGQSLFDISQGFPPPGSGSVSLLLNPEL